MRAHSAIVFRLAFGAVRVSHLNYSSGAADRCCREQARERVVHKLCSQSQLFVWMIFIKICPDFAFIVFGGFFSSNTNELDGIQFVHSA